MNDLTEKQILRSAVNRAMKVIYLISGVGMIIFMGFGAIVDTTLIKPIFITGVGFLAVLTSISKMIVLKMFEQMKGLEKQKIIDLEIKRLNKQKYKRN